MGSCIGPGTLLDALSLMLSEHLLQERNCQFGPDPMLVSLIEKYEVAANLQLCMHMC